MAGMAAGADSIDDMDLLRDGAMEAFFGRVRAVCADHAHIPELKTLASTIEKWQQPAIDAVLTGYSNAKAEAHNRTAELVARAARGFANPANQARRVRMATTRGARPGTRPRKPRQSRKSPGPEPPITISNGRTWLKTAPRSQDPG